MRAYLTDAGVRALTAHQERGRPFAQDPLCSKSRVEASL